MGTFLRHSVEAADTEHIAVVVRTIDFNFSFLPVYNVSLQVVPCLGAPYRIHAQLLIFASNVCQCSVDIFLTSTYLACS